MYSSHYLPVRFSGNNMTTQQSPPSIEPENGSGLTGNIALTAKTYKIRFQTPRVIFALLIREISTTFGRSSLGYLWAILEPIGIIAMFTVVFSIVFRNPPLGNSFLLFYATGYIPFAIYNAGQAKISSCISQNKMLLFYPAVEYVDVIVARTILIGLTEFTVALIVFFGVIIMYDTGARPEYLPLFGALFLALMLGASVGLINATLFEIMPSWRSVWHILSRPMFFISGLFFLYEDLSKTIQDILWWNPVLHIISLLRRGMYPEYEAEHASVLYVVFISIIIAAIGLINLRTSNKFIMNN